MRTGSSRSPGAAVPTPLQSFVGFLLGVLVVRRDWLDALDRAGVGHDDARWPLSR